MPNFNMIFSSNWMGSNALSGSNKLKSIKIPKGQTCGHYMFAGLPSLEWVELGSVGNAWRGGGYFMGFPAGAYYHGRNFGSPAGLTIEAYMTAYNATAGFSPGGPASDTTIIIRSPETGEIITPESTTES